MTDEIYLKCLYLVCELNSYFFMECVCSAQSRNRDNSRIILDKVGILTLSGEVGIPTWDGSIPESSLRKVGIGAK